MSASSPRTALGRRRLVSTGALVALAATVLVSGVLTADRLQLYGWDFREQYFLGARYVAEGAPLYPSLDEIARQGPGEYVFPPLTAVALAPFTFLPEDAAVVLAVLVSLAAVLAALALVGLRDIRCYAAVVASAPFWSIAETANLTAVLTLCVALAWRYRAAVWPSAIALGVAISAKLFLWPMVAWLFATSRYRAAVSAVAVGLGTTLAAWAVVGFDGFTDFPALLMRLDEVWAEESRSIVGMSSALGFEPQVGWVASIIVGGALLTVCVVIGRSGDDRRAFTCALAGALALTPIVWVHYVVYLLVPLAISRPRFSAVWLLPMVLWVSPRTLDGHGFEPFVVGVVVTVMLVVLLTRPSPRPERAVPAPA